MKNWTTSSVSELCTLHYGKSPKEIEIEGGVFPIYGTGGVVGFTDKYLYANPSIILGRKGSIGNVHYVDMPFWTIDTTFYVEPKSCDVKWLYYVFSNLNLEKLNEATGVPSLSRNNIYAQRLFIPKEKNEQQKIAEVLSTADQKIDLINQKITETQKLKTGLMQKLFSEGVGVQDEEGNWELHTEFQVASGVNVPACWNLMSLESIATVERGKFSARPRNDPKYYGGEIPFVQTGDVVNAATYIETYSQTLNELGLTVSKIFPVGTILITIAANIGDVAITKYPLACPDSLVGIQANESKCNVHWLFYFLQTQKSELDSKATKSAQKNINLQVLKPLTVYLPSLEEQSIIAETLSTVDEKLALLEKQKVETQQLKKGLMQKLLTGEWRVPLDNH
ncbi:restriction endonuclease subunit S [Vibrio sp. SG41-7]|uniref:restriction endonuclease subunit S n=1 Tax=Vibrio sp. SG41-7 TaxID=2760973 RepID=UPI0016040754|nr:restriction endonuclease subunit S [Vibrio sp. SG41-7]MBB1461734.1 restriction endonuclease subunit S [Vibrio sp. SG41-7]